MTTANLLKTGISTPLKSYAIYVTRCAALYSWCNLYTLKIKGMAALEGDFRYLACCSNLIWTTIPARYGVKTPGTPGPVHGQANPIVINGIARLSTRVATEEIRCPNCGVRVSLLFAEGSNCIGLIKWSSRRRKNATPQ